MKWLAECSVSALREALGAVAPELSGYPVAVPGPAGKEDPLWHSGCVPVGDRVFVKFAWSRPAALRLAREIGVLAALARGHPHSGSRTWPRASAHSASTPKRHQQPTSAEGTGKGEDYRPAAPVHRLTWAVASIS
jgi:hypothetical protein